MKLNQLESNWNPLDQLAWNSADDTNALNPLVKVTKKSKECALSVIFILLHRSVPPVRYLQQPRMWYLLCLDDFIMSVTANVRRMWGQVGWQKTGIRIISKFNLGKVAFTQIQAADWRKVSASHRLSDQVRSPICCLWGGVGFNLFALCLFIKYWVWV